MDWLNFTRNRKNWTWFRRNTIFSFRLNIFRLFYCSSAFYETLIAYQTSNNHKIAQQAGQIRFYYSTTHFGDLLLLWMGLVEISHSKLLVAIKLLFWFIRSSNKSPQKVLKNHGFYLIELPETVIYICNQTRNIRGKQWLPNRHQIGFNWIITIQNSLLFRADGSNLLLDPYLICKKSHRLRGKYSEMCKNETFLMREISRGISMGFRECEYQFKHHRWNCTSIARSMRKILLKGNSCFISFCDAWPPVWLSLLKQN